MILPSHQPARTFQGPALPSSGLMQVLGQLPRVVAIVCWLLIVYAAPARAQDATATHEVHTECGTNNCPDWTGVIRKRIGPPSPDTLETFRGVGVSDIRSKTLTDAEWDLVASALSRIPTLHRCVLMHRLRRLSFLDLPPGLGTALVSKNDTEDAETTFDLTLRSSLLDQTLSELLTTKETHLFASNGSDVKVRFDAGNTDALSYVLLHETTHIVDDALGISSSEDGLFRTGVWVSERAIAEPFASSLAANTWFRMGPKIPHQSAPQYYEALKKTPFVSFYATASVYEDLAELIALQQLASQADQKLTVTVHDGNGDTLFEYAPLEQPAVQQRFRQVQEFLNTQETACTTTSAE